MIASLVACALLAAAAASQCGPSANNYLIARLNQPGSPTNGATACALYNMDTVNLTTTNSAEVAGLIYSCLGSYRNALIGSWNGVNYGVSCLEAFVTTSPTSIAVSALATCAPPNAVVCQQRGTQPIVLPPPSTISTTLTQSVTTTTRSTIPKTDVITSTLSIFTSTEKLTETSTTTSISSASIACTEGQYVFISEPVSHTNAQGVCRRYGMDLAYIDNIVTFSAGSCYSPSKSYWTRPTLPKNSGYMTGRFRTNAVTLGKVDSLVLTLHPNLATFTSPTDLICQTTDTSIGRNDYWKQQYISSLTYIQACLNGSPDNAPAIYPLDSVTGLPNIKNAAASANFEAILPNFTAPVSVSCSYIDMNGIDSDQKVHVTGCSVTGINGVICQLPQQVPPTP